MARARNIKPALFKNEILGTADPLITLLFEGLWLLCDREGRMEDRPVRIKGELFPYRDGVNVDEMLSWLHNRAFVTRYQVDGGKYILINKFVEHQNPHKHEAASVIPPPESDGEGRRRSRKNRAEPANGGTESGNSGTRPADSLLLNPDSPTPENPNPGSAGFRIPLPFDSERFSKAWGLWEQHRSEKRVKLTETSVRQQFAKLAEMGEDRAIAAIEHSVAGGYQGIYEPTGQTPHKRAGPKDRDAELIGQINEAMHRGTP